MIIKRTRLPPEQNEKETKDLDFIGMFTSTVSTILDPGKFFGTLIFRFFAPHFMFASALTDVSSPFVLLFLRSTFATSPLLFHGSYPNRPSLLVDTIEIYSVCGILSNSPSSFSNSAPTRARISSRTRRNSAASSDFAGSSKGQCTTFFTPWSIGQASSAAGPHTVMTRSTGDSAEATPAMSSTFSEKCNNFGTFF